MTSPSGGPFRAQFDAAVAAAGLQVTKENVLVFRDSIYRECERLDKDLIAHSKNALNLPRLGGDPVSGDASRAFPNRVQKLLDQCRQYVEDLRGAAGALNRTALSYGLTEDDIANTFHAAAATTSTHTGDSDRGAAAVPAPAPAKPPNVTYLAPGPGAITAALEPGTPSGAV